MTLRNFVLHLGVLWISSTSAQDPTFVKNVKPGEGGAPTPLGPLPVTGEAGVVVTYIPFQDPAQATITDIVTVPNDQGGENVFHPGGWIWTLAAPPPPDQPVPPAPTQPPVVVGSDGDEGSNNGGTDEPEGGNQEAEVVVTGDGGVQVTYAPFQDPAYTEVSEITTTTREDDDSEIIIFPGGWIWSVKGPQPDGPLPPAPTQPPGVENDVEEAEVTVTGDGVSITYFPSQDPEYTEVAQVTTKAGDGDDDDDIVIFPGGWIWKMKGPKPPGSGPIPPPPSGPPGPGGGGGSEGGDQKENDDDEDDDDDEEEECSTTTAPPECTKTISYVSVGTDYTTTELGECSSVTKCVSGEQSTTTTTISTTNDVIIGLLPDATQIPEVEDTGKISSELGKYLQEYYESEKISLQDVLSVNGQPVCRGGLVPVLRECLRLMIDEFCGNFDGSSQEVKLDAAKVLEKRGAPRQALHLTSLQRRQGKANANSCGSLDYNFSWESAEGECNGSCEEALGALGSKCGRAPDAIDKEGSIEVSCGTYSYWMSEKEEGGNDGGNDGSGDGDADEDEDEDEDEDGDDDEGEVAEPDIDISPPFEVPPGSPVGD